MEVCVVQGEVEVGMAGRRWEEWLNEEITQAGRG